MFRKGTWLSGIETWNFGTALLILAVLVAVFTPLADPNRIAVADQMARLQNHKVAADRFDVRFLHTSGRFGLDALVALAAKPSPLQKRARDVLAGNFDATASPQTRRSAIVMMTRGAAVPDDFVRQDWQPGSEALPLCLTGGYGSCKAWLMDVGGSHAILLNQGSNFYAFARDGKGTWQEIGYWTAPACNDVTAAIASGGFGFAAPRHPVPDLMIAGRRIPGQSAPVTGCDSR